ncbi:hypothetical protein EDD85DRAFT_782344, partial [Armillaria nabsnona]
KFMLNTEQEITFRIMADNFINSEPEPFLLCMFLTGPRGTGKTHVIKVLCDVMDVFGYRHAVRFIAPTGSSAALNDGPTVHKAFRIKSMYSATLSKATCRKLWETFKDVEVLVIDEVLLLQLELLLEIDAGCCYGKD